MTESQVIKPVVVVGVDGSLQSCEALRWAARYVASIGGELRAVIVWEQLPGFGYFPGGTRSLELEARGTLERTIEKALGPQPPMTVETKVLRGNPTPVLVEESKGAHLLVVGDRGYGGFAGLLLGSVGERCAREAECSVVIVRDGS